MNHSKWRADHDTALARNEFTLFDENNKYIGRVTLASTDLKDADSIPRMFAHAKLIASAPELQEENKNLRKALMKVDFVSKMLGSKPLTPKDLKQALKKYKDKKQPEIVSNCCGARIIENSDLCSKCKEHCGTEKI